MTGHPDSARPASQIELPPPVLVDSPAAFDRMLATLAGEPILALDTESDSLYRYFYRVCLIQISSRTNDYLVDPLRLSDLGPLGKLLADPAVEKVFHAAENDILVLKRDFGFRFANIFDTMLAARILGWRRAGLASILAEQFGIQLDKRVQLTDWGQRPLTPEQLSYARLDSHYLLPLRDVLVADLRARGRWREAVETFATLPDTPYIEKGFDPDGFWRYRGVRDLSPAELAVLRSLHCWRDEQARAMNRPPFKVLSDDILVQLSRLQPRRIEDLPLSPWQARRFGQTLLTIIQRSRRAAPPQPPARNSSGNGRPDPALLSRFDQLRAWRTRRAAERDVESDIVLTNEALMTIARAAPTTLEELARLGVMGTWKLEEYGPEILQVISDSRVQ